MIIPYVVSYSLMFGAILSNGIMWPLISRQEGNWYPAGQPAQSFEGLFGYKVSPCSILHASKCRGNEVGSEGRSPSVLNLLYLSRSKVP